MSMAPGSGIRVARSAAPRTLPVPVTPPSGSALSALTAPDPISGPGASRVRSGEVVDGG